MYRGRKHAQHAIALGMLSLVWGSCVLSDPTLLFDADEDGLASGVDCDDSDPSIGSRFADADGDGFGGGSWDDGCDVGTLEGYAAEGGDCDDEKADVYPGQLEVCNGVDDDCDGESDEGFDQDGDGYLSCDVDDSESSNVYGDCDDEDPSRNPGQIDTLNGIDDDCDGSIDEDFDEDRDGYFLCQESSISPDGNLCDCDDGSGATYPGADEVCDSGDNDCDGESDEALPKVLYPDNDGDGSGGVWPDPETARCMPLDDVAPEGYSEDRLDCDDLDPYVNPDAEEVCDGVDNDCDALVDEGLLTLYYLDADGDGYGVSGTAYPGCTESGAPYGYADNREDCDDTDADIHRGADEACDGIDNDCDGSVDEGLDDVAYYADDDGDGFGGGEPVQGCDPSRTWSQTGGDCDDESPSTYPGAYDVIGDGEDSDCNGTEDLLSVLAGGGSEPMSADGEYATTVKLTGLAGIAVDERGGSVYVALADEHRVLQIDLSGRLFLVAGDGEAGFAGDGGPATDARLDAPRDVAVDDEGNVYLSDTGNNRIRLIGLDGKIESIAGGGGTQVAGQDGLAASEVALNQPQGLAFRGDALYFADSENHLVRRLERTGEEWTLIDVTGDGTAGYLGDGGAASSARVNSPYSVALDLDGLLYLADTGNHRIRAVDGDDIIRTIVGGQGTNYPGDGSDGLDLGLGYPPAVAVGEKGHVYFVDGLEGVIRMMDPDGSVTTLFTLEAPADDRTISELPYPSDICLTGNGEMIIADPVAGMVLEITP